MWHSPYNPNPPSPINAQMKTPTTFTKRDHFLITVVTAHWAGESRKDEHNLFNLFPVATKKILIYQLMPGRWQLNCPDSSHAHQSESSSQTKWCPVQSCTGLRQAAFLLLWITEKLSAPCRVKLETGEMIDCFKHPHLTVITIIRAHSHVPGNKADFQ